MKKIELHKAGRLHRAGTTYLRGKVYQVSASLFDELMALKNERGIPYFRAPLTKAQQQAILERTSIKPQSDGTLDTARRDGGRNVIRVEPEGDEAPKEKPAVVSSPGKSEASVESGGDEDGAISV